METVQWSWLLNENNTDPMYWNRDEIYIGLRTKERFKLFSSTNRTVYLTYTKIGAVFFGIGFRILFSFFLHEFGVVYPI